MKSRKMRWVRHVAHMGKRRVLVEKPEGKRPLGRPEKRGEGNIKKGLEEGGGGGGNGLD